LPSMSMIEYYGHIFRQKVFGGGEGVFDDVVETFKKILLEDYGWKCTNGRLGPIIGQLSFDTTAIGNGLYAAAGSGKRTFVLGLRAERIDGRLTVRARVCPDNDPEIRQLCRTHGRELRDHVACWSLHDPGHQLSFAGSLCHWPYRRRLCQ
jgi:hypothetical protein